MVRIRLISRNEDLVLEHAHILKKAGLNVDASPFQVSGMITRLRENPPALIVIDLDRLPSWGRGVALILRTSSMRHVPIVFAGGTDEKVERVRAELPDAIFIPWPRRLPQCRER